MDPTVNYYVTTLTTAFKNIAPVLVFIIGGYFVFVKLPFLFLKKSMDDQKKKLHEENKDLVAPEKKYSVEDYKEFQRKMKLMNDSESSAPKNKILELPGQKKSDTKQEQKRERPQQEKKKESPKEPPKKPEAPAAQSPEQIFNFRSNESFTKSELKKRYFELLKQNHPDRVASLGQDFKKLAEKNTKEINRAYDKLKEKAS